MEAQPLMYTELADWWPVLSRPADYEEEAGIFTRTIQQMLPEAHTLLELGSGGGNNASFLKQHFQVTLVDRSPHMLAVSQRLNPELPHLPGDMRDVRLGQTFDAVFIHDAIMYLTSEADLLQAFETAFAHTRPGGMALFVPDCVRETFHAESSWGGHDGADVTPPQPKRALRYLEWTYDPDPQDSTYLVDYTFLLREGAQAVRCVYDRHVNGLFPRATWLHLIAQAGFQPRALPYQHSEFSEPADLFVGLKPVQ